LDEVKKVLTNQVKKQPEFPGMNLLSSFVYQNALIDLKAGGVTTSLKPRGGED